MFIINSLMFMSMNKLLTSMLKKPKRTTMLELIIKASAKVLASVVSSLYLAIACLVEDLANCRSLTLNLAIRIFRVTFLMSSSLSVLLKLSSLHKKLPVFLIFL